MLERYFVMPSTVDRIHGSWIGPEIERYVVWLAEHGYRPRTVLRRVPPRACEPPGTSVGSPTKPIWRSDQTLLDWLAAL